MTNTDKKKQRRRDILKAAVGAPAVFTLPTGSALAATSLTCVDKGNQLPTPNGVTTTASSDTWIRYSVPAISFRKSVSGNVRANGFKLSKSGGLAGFDYYEVSGTTINQVIPHNNVNEMPVVGITNYYLLVDSKAYLDTKAPKDYIYLGTAISQPVAGASCWNSVIATPGIKTLTSNLIN